MKQILARFHGDVELRRYGTTTFLRLGDQIVRVGNDQTCRLMDLVGSQMISLWTNADAVLVERDGVRAIAVYDQHGRRVYGG